MDRFLLIPWIWVLEILCELHANMAIRSIFREKKIGYVQYLYYKMLFAGLYVMVTNRSIKLHSF